MDAALTEGYGERKNAEQSKCKVMRLPYTYIALIPAYQPTDFLVELACKLASGFSVVLVDDGSGKAYETVFDRCLPYATILHHDANAGKGRALKTGLSYILKSFAPDHIVVTIDADGQHRVDDAAALCRTAEQTPGSLILGCRKLKGDVPLRSRFGNTVTRLIYRLSTGLAVYDTQTGLRAFDMSLIPKLLSIPGERYEYEMNVLLYFARESIPIREQEIKTIYLDNNSASHFDTARDSVRIYKEILKFSASSFIGFMVDYASYSLLLLLTDHLRLSNLAARVISAGVNFTINRRLVFHSRKNLGKAALQYGVLAAVILLGNTLTLEFLVFTCGVHQMFAKILTDILFFVLSWLTKRFVIFKREKRGALH